MGGHAFASRGLITPRMPPAVYSWVRDECHRKLRQLYLCVASPIEGPGKKDYGDVDIFVALERRAIFPQNQVDRALPHTRFGQDDLAQIGQHLGAEYVVYLPHNKSANMAVPWPAQLPSDMLASEEACNSTALEQYIQIDIQIEPSVEKLQWHLFKHGHGDIWHMIGVITRGLGLTVDEEALWIRIPELEWVNRKASKVKLTSEPVEVLDFLGLSGLGSAHKETNLPIDACENLTTANIERDIVSEDTAGMSVPTLTGTSSLAVADDDGASLLSAWEQPFAAVEDMFEYLTTCRWFFQINPPRFKADSDETDASLNSNDRRRMNSRPLFKKWSTEFIPRLQAEGRFDSARAIEVVRNEVRQEAFNVFPGVEESYRKQLGNHLAQKSRDILSREVIKGVVPEDLEINHRSVAVSALRKIIFQDDESFGVVPEELLRDEYGIYDIDKTRKWVEDHWEEVMDSAWKINQIRCAEAMKKKELKRKMPSEEGQTQV